ncbi:MAG: hypothetical protein ABIR54_06025 [Burkholderiaceae bacterium]
MLDLQAFMPAKNLALAKRFYSDLDFSLAWRPRRRSRTSRRRASGRARTSRVARRQ